MRNNKNAFFALAALGGYSLWRNRFSIQRRLQSLGLKTPLSPRTIQEAAKSIADQASKKMEKGATIAEDIVNKKIS